MRASYTHEFGSSKYDSLIPNILYNITEEKDNTVIAVARYLLNPKRLSTFEVGKFQIRFGKEPHETKEDIENKDVSSFLYDHSFFKLLKYGICFDCCEVNCYTERLNKLKSYNSDYKEKENWDYVKDLSLYIDKNGDVAVYTNSSKQAAIVIYPENLSNNVFQLVSTCFTRMFPFAFKGENKITDEETRALKAIYKEDYKTFTNIIQNYLTKNDFRRMQLEKQLTGFCEIDIKEKIDKIESEINQSRSLVDEYLSKIRQEREKINSKNAELNMYVNGDIDPKKDEQDIIDFICSNKSLDITKIDRYGFNILFTGYITEFDEDCYDSVISNTRSYLYRNSKFSYEDLRMALDAIFKDSRWKVRGYCEWKIKRNWEVKASKCDIYDDDVIKNRIPNPHIQYHQCFTEYATQMTMMGLDRNYVGILSMIITSSSFINWSDSLVVGEFISDLQKDSVKMLEDKDGNVYNMREVIDILKSEKEKNNASY